MTATASRPGVSCASVNTRPSSGRTPITSKKLAVACAPLRRSGSSAPVSVNALLV